MKKKIGLSRDKIDFGKGKIGPLFRALFFPTLIGMIFMSLQTVIDGIFVGRGVGADGIAAVNIVAPLWMVVTGLGLMFGIGASVIGSLHLAEKNVKAARIILTQAFGVGFAIMVVLSLLCLCFPKTVVYSLGCSERLEAFALDWIFIFPLGMGVKGAAIATAIACIVGGLMALVYFLGFSAKLKFYRLKMSHTSVCLTLRNVGNMAKIGSATFLTEIAMSVTILAGNYMFMSLLHEDGVAAYAVVCYLFPVIFSVNNAVAQSAQPIISYNYGARQMERVSQTLRVSVLTAATCGLLVMLMLIAGDETIVGMFLRPQEKAYQLAVEGLPWFSTCSVFFALNVVFVGYYQSLTNAGKAMAFTCLRGIVLTVAGFAVLPLLLGTIGLWLAIPAAELLTLAVIVVAAKLLF